MVTTTTWMLRQNPCGKTNQISMMEFIKKEMIITCPFGHVTEASNYVDQFVFNTYDEDGKTSGNQDRRFVRDMKIGDIVLIPFVKHENPNILVVKVESDAMPSKSFKDMLVIYEQGTVVKITHDLNGQYTGSQYEVKLFRPVYRKISILIEIERPEEISFLQRSFCKASQKMIEWVQQYL